MKFRDRVDLNVLSPYSMYAPEAFLRRVRLYCQNFPDMLPENSDWSEPFKQPFNPNDLEAMVPPSRKCEMLWWQRTAKPKADGMFGVRWTSRVQHLMDTHGKLTLSVELAQADQGRLVDYLKSASIDCEADIALLDSLTDSYRDFAKTSRSTIFDGNSYNLVTNTLRHWLPDVFWGTVLEPAYVRLFGKEKLLSAPAFTVEELGAEMVYLQLSSSLTDLHTEFNSVQSVRAKVKQHLGIRAFFDPSSAYETSERGPIGAVFLVPQFQFKSD